MIRRQRRLLHPQGLLAALYVSLAIAASALAQTPGSQSPFPLNWEADPAVQQLWRLVAATNPGDVSESTIETLNQLQLKHSAALIAFSPDHWLRADLLVDVCLQQLPEDAHRRWRERRPDTLDRSWAAVSLRADQLWREGHIEAARLSWLSTAGLDSSNLSANQWPARFPAAPLADQAECLQRMIVAHLLAGEFRSAAHRLDQLRVTAPDRRGVVLGQPGIWTEILSRRLAEAVQADREQFLPAPALPFEASQLRLAESSWAAPLTLKNVTPNEERRLVIAEDCVLVGDAVGVRALDPATGAACWPAPMEGDAGYLFSAEARSTSWQGEIQGHVWHGWGQTSDGPRAAVDYAACDLDTEGRLLWLQRPAQKLESQSPLDWRLIASPLFDEQGSVWAFHDPRQGAVALLSLNSQGDRNWTTPHWPWLLPWRGNAAEQGGALAAHGDQTFCLIQNAVLIALNRGTGDVHWARRFPAPLATTLLTTPITRAALACSDDRLYVLRDEQLHALNTTTGAAVWTREVPSGARLLVGLVDDTLLLGGGGVGGVNVFTGALHWWRDDQSLTARPLVRGATLLVPGPGELQLLNAYSGQPADSPIRLETLQPDDSLGAAEQRLFRMNADQLTAVECEWTRTRLRAPPAAVPQTE